MVKFSTLRAARLLGLASFAVAGALRFSSVSAQSTYPDKPIRFVVPFSAGTTTDVIARVYADKLGKLLGQSVIVENKAGAGGNISAEFVARAAPDGYTLTFSNSATNATNPTLYKKVNFDPIKDFTHIALMVSAPNMLAINPKIPANNMAELIAYAKKNPGQLNYASSGNGSPVHLAGAIFADATKIDVVHIPYRGGAIANTSVMSGDTQYTFASMPAAMPQVKAGKLRALAVTTKVRSPQLPDVPSVEEAGSLPGYDINTWDALLAPKGTPPAVIEKLNAAIRQALQSPALAKRFEGEGAIPDTSTPQELATFIDAELLKWAAVVASVSRSASGWRRRSR